MKYLNIPIPHLLLIPLFLFLTRQERVSAQYGIEAQSLTEQWLAAYSTDFSHGNKITFYESPNPKGKDIWVLEDMLEIDFTELLGLNPGDAPYAAMKAIINKSDIPAEATEKDAIRVEMFLYDPSLDLGYDPEKKLIEFMTSEDWTNRTDNADKFISIYNKVNRGKLNEYRSNRIKEVLFNSGSLGLFDTWDPDPYMIRKVVVRIEFYYPAKITQLRLPGLGVVEPQKLLYASRKNTFDLPAQEKIVDFPGIGDIYRWQWINDARLYGTTNQILNIAEVNLKADSDLELKLDYVFKDPRRDPNNFNPKTLRSKNSDSRGLKTVKELAESESMELVEPIMLDQPQSGMFDIVSNRAARAGALFAVNGAFYDYYYYCLPGVKTSLKIDGKWHYKPDIFNHRNTGALVFDNTSFDFIRNEKHDEYIGKENGETYDQAKNAYALKGAPWSNLMSGGHFSELGKPYRFHKPGVLKEIERNTKAGEDGKLSFFWQKPKLYYNMGDESVPGQEEKGTIAHRYEKWNKEEFGIWARIACQRRDDRDKILGDYQQMRKLTDKNNNVIKDELGLDKLVPDTNMYSFSDLFMPELLTSPKSVTIGNASIATTPKDATNLYTSIDYARYPHEFGLQKRGRTFIAKKDDLLYIMTADGLYAPGCLYGGQTKAQYYATTAPGLTIDELSDLSQKLDFDALLNLDGGGSSTFFVNGKGMLQNPYAGTAEGPMQQRYLSTTLMVVPKIQTHNIKAESSVNDHYLSFNNLNLDSDQYQYTTTTRCTYEGGTVVSELVPDIDYNKWAPVSALSLTPSLDKFISGPNAGNGGLIGGNFKNETDEICNGIVLFAMSENGQYYHDKNEHTGMDIGGPIAETRSLFVVGVGQIPDRLLKVLRPLKVTLPEDRQSKWEHITEENNQSFYTFLINDNKVEFFFVENSGEGENKSHRYLDDKWHNFILYFDRDDTNQVVNVNAFLDGEAMNQQSEYNYTSEDMYTENIGFFNADHITHAMIGAIPLQGSYVTNANSTLDVDNFMFVIGSQALEEFYRTAESVQTDLEGSPTLYNVLKKVSHDITKNNHQLPPSYTGFDWNDPNKNQWYLQFEEGKGYHAHAVNDQEKAHFYGLNLWGSWVTKKSSTKKEIADTDKALDSIVDPVTDQPLETANVNQEASSADITPNSEGPSDASAVLNGLADDTLRHSWNVYPNPASSTLFLDLVLEESTPLDIYLFNLSGQQLFHARSARMDRGKQRVDLGEIVHHFGGKQQLYTLKVRGNGFAPIDAKVMIK